MDSLTLTQSELENLLETIALEVSRRLGTTAGTSEEGSPSSAITLGHAECACTSVSTRELRALAGLIDHTLLRPEASRAQVEHLAEEARRAGFASACVHLAWVPVVAERLRGSGVKVATVVGFPFGATGTTVKRAEAEAAMLAGASEIDMVMNVGAMKSGDLARVENDIRGVVEVCRSGGALLKVILENAYLSTEEKTSACLIAKSSGADFVKTSTGFAPTGATEEDVRLMRQAVGPTMGVKAAGGIRTLEHALRMLQAGATRLGSSASVSILEEASRALQPVN